MLSRIQAAEEANKLKRLSSTTSKSTCATTMMGNVIVGSSLNYDDSELFQPLATSTPRKRVPAQSSNTIEFVQPMANSGSTFKREEHATPLRTKKLILAKNRNQVSKVLNVEKAPPTTLLRKFANKLNQIKEAGKETMERTIKKATGGLQRKKLNSLPMVTQKRSDVEVTPYDSGYSNESWETSKSDVEIEQSEDLQPIGKVKFTAASSLKNKAESFSNTR